MKYFGKVAYYGDAYFGFERQPNCKTIQGELERALSTLMNEPVQIKGAGRTDAGVNALGQTFSFDSNLVLEDVSRYASVLNRLLPEDIRVLEFSYAPEGFDARHSCCGKIYEYRFSWGERNPFEKGRVAQFERRDFDPKLFEEALRCFEGTHNFQNFTSKPEDIDGFVRTIKPIQIHVDENKKAGTLIFKADGFMRYQIRFMIGAAFQCATHSLSVSELATMLNRNPRQIVSFKAPAAGLYLTEVLYDEKARL